MNFLPGWHGVAGMMQKPGKSAPAFIGYDYMNGTSSSDITVSAPTARVAGDILILGVFTHNTTTLPTIPVGNYTPQTSVTGSAAAGSLRVFSRVATGDTNDNVTVDIKTGASGSVGLIAAYRGAASVDISQQQSYDITGDGNPFSYGAIGVLSPGPQRVLQVFGGRSAAGNFSSGTPGASYVTDANGAANITPSGYATVVIDACNVAANGSAPSEARTMPNSPTLVLRSAFSLVPV